MRNIPLTIIIPVRAEEESIIKTLERISKDVHTPSNILIADDCIDPKDKTIDLVKRYSKNHKNVRIHIKKSSDQDGFGPALSRAITSVRTPYLVIVMADSCDNPETIDKMMAKMKTDAYDVIVGCRYMDHAKKFGGPLIQHIGSTTVNRILPVIAHFPTRDGTNAFKLWRTPFVQSILPKNPFPGVEFSFQLAIEARNHNGRFLDIPTEWSGRTLGKSKFCLFKQIITYMGLFAKAIITPS